MTITPDSPLVGPPSGTLHAALDYAGTENAEYVNEVWRLATLVGIDPAIMVAQSSHETADWTSTWWFTRYNPAGIGITGDPAQNEKSQIWANQTDAARGHVAHMVAYVGGRFPEIKEPALAHSLPLSFYDKRIYHVTSQPWAGTIRTIRDLTGKWATDPLYHDGIIRKHRAIFGAGEETVASPVIYNLATDYARFGLTKAESNKILSQRFEMRWDADNQAQGDESFIVFHIQDGRTPGSLRHWLTARASSTVMIQRDGSILQVIPEHHGPWTNGDDYAPTARGQLLVNMPGNSNIWTLSIEAEGTPDDPPTNYPAQMNAIEWQARDWMARYPKTKPATHRLRHADVDQINKPNCPGNYYPVIMARLETAPPPTEPIVAPIWWQPGDIGPQQRESDGAWALAMVGEVTAKRKVPVRVSADSNSTVIETLEIGDKRKLVGTGKYRNRWNFIEVSPGVYGRALWSAFHERFPTL